MTWRTGRPLPGSIDEAALKIERLLDREEAERLGQSSHRAPASSLGGLPT
jgi:hypothetical protein